MQRIASLFDSLSLQHNHVKSLLHQKVKECMLDYVLSLIPCMFIVEESHERRQLPTDDAEEDDPSRLGLDELTSIGKLIHYNDR